MNAMLSLYYAGIMGSVAIKVLCVSPVQLQSIQFGGATEPA